MYTKMYASMYAFDANEEAVISSAVTAIHAIAARFDSRLASIVVKFSNGVEIAVPVRLIEELADAAPDDPALIKITPAAIGLHWPRLDADLYVPALMNGVFGSKRWMAGELGAEGGRSCSEAKVAAARRNGARGGRPHKIA